MGCRRAILSLLISCECTAFFSGKFRCALPFEKFAVSPDFAEGINEEFLCISPVNAQCLTGTIVNYQECVHSRKGRRGWHSPREQRRERGSSAVTEETSAAKEKFEEAAEEAF